MCLPHVLMSQHPEIVVNSVLGWRTLELVSCVNEGEEKLQLGLLCG